MDVKGILTLRARYVYGQVFVSFCFILGKYFFLLLSLHAVLGHMHWLSHWHYLPILKNLVDSLKELALIVKSYCYRFKINGIYIGEIIKLLEIRILKEESRRIWNVGGRSPVSCRWQYYIKLIPLMNPIWNVQCFDFGQHIIPFSCTHPNIIMALQLYPSISVGEISKDLETLIGNISVIVKD